jgi:hypothetical protein
MARFSGGMSRAIVIKVWSWASLMRERHGATYTVCRSLLLAAIYRRTADALAPPSAAIEPDALTILLDGERRG